MMDLRSQVLVHLGRRFWRAEHVREFARDQAPEVFEILVEVLETETLTERQTSNALAATLTLYLAANQSSAVRLVDWLVKTLRIKSTPTLGSTASTILFLDERRKVPFLPEEQIRDLRSLTKG